MLHLLHQPWSLEEFATAIAAHPTLVPFANINPTSPSAEADLLRAKDLGYRGLKLHPRLQGYQPDTPDCVDLVRAAGALGWPVTVDCFPDGDWLMAGHDVRQYARLAREAPGARVVVAHAAGHHCLDLLMLAKRTPNLWMDLSYSLLYYEGPVVDNLFYCLRSLRHERVLFGTDHPDRPLAVAVSRSEALFARHGLIGEPLEKLLWKNAQQLLQAA